MTKNLFLSAGGVFASLTLLMPFAWAESQPTSRWESVIAAFEAADRETPQPQGAVLFIGSSSIRGWRSVAVDFPEYKVINRGFGGSTIADSVEFADRIVLPYKPATIVFYAGENDLNGGLTPEQVADDFKTFVSVVHRELPETRIAFVSMKPSPSRERILEAMREGNKLIYDFATKTENVDYIDVFHPMLNAEGKARDELFVGDQLHLNAEGYELWKRIVGPYLQSIGR